MGTLSKSLELPKLLGRAKLQLKSCAWSDERRGNLMVACRGRGRRSCGVRGVGEGVHLSVSTVVLVYLCPVGAINHSLAEHFLVLEIRKPMPPPWGSPMSHV